jgi:hypothetical protein
MFHEIVDVDPNNLNSTTTKKVMAINVHKNQLEANNNAKSNHNVN